MPGIYNACNGIATKGSLRPHNSFAKECQEFTTIAKVFEPRETYVHTAHFRGMQRIHNDCKGIPTKGNLRPPNPFPEIAKNAQRS